MLKNSFVFVDSRVSNYQSLLASLAEPAEVFVLNGESDGLGQMAAQLQGRTGMMRFTSFRMAARGRCIWAARCLIAGIWRRTACSLPALGLL
ncbi:MAG: DUF4347 domain-containing protein [Rhodoferax sp.]|nr:DUF4347 domain-containing protein [Rhodoferax sp.]